MPAVPVGYCKFAADFPGSISVNSRVVKEIVYSTGSSLATQGFKYLIICTYHMAIPHLKGIYSAMKKIQSKHNMKTCEPWGPYLYSNKLEKNEPKSELKKYLESFIFSEPIIKEKETSMLILLSKKK